MLPRKHELESQKQSRPKYSAPASGYQEGSRGSWVSVPRTTYIVHGRQSVD